ncbi:MAG TPA: NAD(P)/FAD-dependent oxidoreductase [Kofleriaceae bacterium]|nr:NAD(P)/FAD-dependent oxidoreductase [Kofleriaceae bacterium]
MTASVVIGAGLNGLTCATLLARKGHKVVVLEAAGAAGGIAAPVEFHPGYRSAGVLHDTSGLRPRAVSQLALEQHGLKLRGRRPDVVALAGDQRLSIPGDGEAARVRAALGADADGYLRYRAALDRMRPVLASFLDMPPVDVVRVETVSRWELLKRAMKVRRLGRRDMLELLRLPPMCVADWLGEFMTSAPLKAALAWPAVTGDFLGPWSPGSTATLLLAEAAAGPGVEGGGSAIAAALEKAARAAGVTIRTGARAARIAVDKGAVTGVELAGGERVAADLVAATCHPRTVFLDLLPPAATAFRLRERIASFRSRGTTAQVLLAVEKPIELPDGAALARVAGHVDDIERAFDAVKHRRSPDAAVLEVAVPSASDPSLAPAGAAVLSAHVFAPYAVEGGWTDAAREKLARRVIEVLDRHLPGVREAVVGKAVLAPPDIEARYGLPGGNLHHGEHGLDQLLVRPIPECIGYRTPIAGLYLAGSGSHPGGGLTCAPGLLAAETILAG